ncbi:uncharacterized protein LOC106869300 isoform X1 [Octopus bimaculoides]|uniref:uncharacterized protein LOC106869300 isoform X1 n=1 Tax=Octopus bimaculoides TaxID=37653 RepID=UPI00071CCB63|nr:uncharacterized protein LOC106869300 isoform X1 [Octopus bimaculoides]XP_052825150.1 uncharacterized protein LOC106869300 isoform X1 [Octopus bimaculoides]XP_052825151.1 uncharacterized protein LOC106869300 isoform X1 [Octopus bimaculoides]XP_052825152.1 uncharacterized protein LOC106869300 isoform X1 [Octopus bimaculoides]|eukprot:XP_014770462.1 PREDICTED: uncharacterized protein LOC106869300 isoform X1 [Octopus bimaculoides]
MSSPIPPGDRKNSAIRVSAIRALVAETLILAKTHGYADKIENELEEELRRDSKGPPKEISARLRRKGEMFFHSRFVILTVVILCVLDCALVLGELILDLHSVRDTLQETEKLSDSFINKLRNKYPTDMEGMQEHLIYVYEKVLDSVMTWPKNSSVPNTTRPTRSRRAADVDPIMEKWNVHVRLPGSHTLEEEIGHAFHLASISILAVLVAGTLLKMICFGTRFFKGKLEVFDAAILIVSFIVDLIFVNGLPRYKIEEFVFILAFLLPWRVIRVVNSLVVAVKDHEHFRLKLVYSRKKKILAVLKQKELKLDLFQTQIDSLRKLCVSHGITDSQINQCLYQEEPKEYGNIICAVVSRRRLSVEPKSSKKTRLKAFSSSLDTPNSRKASKESVSTLIRENHKPQPDVQVGIEEDQKSPDSVIYNDLEDIESNSSQSRP